MVVSTGLVKGLDQVVVIRSLSGWGERGNLDYRISLWYNLEDLECLVFSFCCCFLLGGLFLEIWVKNSPSPDSSFCAQAWRRQAPLRSVCPAGIWWESKGGAGSEGRGGERYWKRMWLTENISKMICHHNFLLNNFLNKNFHINLIRNKNFNLLLFASLVFLEILKKYTNS